eukprot:gene2930-3508_t
MDEVRPTISIAAAHADVVVFAHPSVDPGCGFGWKKRKENNRPSTLHRKEDMPARIVEVVLKLDTITLPTPALPPTLCLIYPHAHPHTHTPPSQLICFKAETCENWAAEGCPAGYKPNPENMRRTESKKHLSEDIPGHLKMAEATKGLAYTTLLGSYLDIDTCCLEMCQHWAVRGCPESYELDGANSLSTDLSPETCCKAGPPASTVEITQYWQGPGAGPLVLQLDGAVAGCFSSMHEPFPHWSGLQQVQQQAWAVLGYTQATWDARIDAGSSAPVLQMAGQAEGDGPLAGVVHTGSCWATLTSAQLTAAQTLCWDGPTWDAAAACTAQTTDGGQCPTPDWFMEQMRPDLVPGKFPSSPCDSITTHRRCVSTHGCEWLRGVIQGACRADPIHRCVADGDCECRAHDFHGNEAHEGDLEIFVPLSVLRANIAPRTADRYSLSVDMPEVFSQGPVTVGDIAPTMCDCACNVRWESGYAYVCGCPPIRTPGMSLTLKFMHTWDLAPPHIEGTLFEGLGIRLILVEDRLSLIVDGVTHLIGGTNIYRNMWESSDLRQGTDTDAYGEHGGSCTCPDGQVYQVGTRPDNPTTLACFGGVPGPINDAPGPWSYHAVRCDVVKDYNCNQLAVVISTGSPAVVYLNNMPTSIPSLTMAAVAAALRASQRVLTLGPVKAKVWDLR